MMPSTLRIFFDAPPATDRAFAWALYDAQGMCLREGRDAYDRWPASEQREAVLSIDLAQPLALSLPPLPASRLDSAVRLALEDRLATPIADQHLVCGTQQRDGRVQVTRLDRTLLSALRELDITRAISIVALTPESAVTSTQGWHWYSDADHKGFICRDDGSAFALDLPAGAIAATVTASTTDKALPAELLWALTESTPPAALSLHLPDIKNAEALVQHWQAAAPCPLRVAAPWDWTRTQAQRWASAADLLPPAESAVSTRPSGTRWRVAIGLLATALALHIAATGIAWGTAFWQQWQIARGWQTLAHEANLPTATVKEIPALWARAYTQQRHRNGLPAPDDALPLLARAAPALAVLPPGALRSAQYADRAWTIDCAPLTPAQQQALETQLRYSGLQTMSGVREQGYRLRLQLQTQLLADVAAGSTR